MDWWEHPYLTRKPVVVPGFPRALYPPDARAQGKAPSENGPDVEAYKRIACRAGRWPGPMSDFDRAYSNAFAHGQSGNVGETGIAGIQRQQGISDTGWIGKATFDLLLSIVIPRGLPHAGEMACDANAANLLAEAFYALHAPAKTLTVREQALKGAIRWLGYTESPAGSNHSTFGEWYGQDYQPWCAMFVTYCYEVEAAGSSSFSKGRNYAYVPYIVADARAKRNGLSVPSTPKPGDLVCFDWGRDGTYDHVGLFEKWGGTSPDSFTAIEGNTSTGNDSNGGQVMRRKRRSSLQGTVFVRVNE